METAAIDHLSFPSAPTEEPSTIQERQLLKDRVYVGNLHPTVDEYSLLQAFSKFGKVTKLDYLFHKTGPLKGKPRGYAFIEYASNDEALKALNMAHDKLLRGRKLVVTFAHQAPPEHGGSPYGTKRRGMMETGRPTTLSLLKTGAGTRNDGTKDKIAMMEAKLRQMESTNPRPAPISELANVSMSTPESVSEVTTSTIHHHPSLPLKPPPPLPEAFVTKVHVSTKPQTSLPVLPLLAPQSLQFRARTDTRHASLHAPTRPTKPKLVGVKIGKTKDKAASLEDN